MWFLLQPLLLLRGFIQYAIIIDQKWTIYMYVVLVLKDSKTYILYKSPHICETIDYMFKYY